VDASQPDLVARYGAGNDACVSYKKATSVTKKGGYLAEERSPIANVQDNVYGKNTIE